MRSLLSVKRVVGYMRPIKDWNVGKKEEFKERVEFTNTQEKRNEAVSGAIKETPAKVLGIFD